MENADLEKFERRSPDQERLPQRSGDTTPAAMIQAALSMGADLDKLERMLKLQNDWEANEARKAYYQAVADFKSNAPDVLKDKKNSQFNSQYVSIGNLLKTVNPALSQHGLSASFDIDQSDKIKVTCTLSHRMGHSESVSMIAPPDTSGGNSKNSIQQIKSTITYLRGATFEAITGIAATDSNLDDDGNASGKSEPITEKQLSQLTDMLNDVNAKDKDIDTFLAYLSKRAKIEITELKNIPASIFQIAVTSLQAKKKQQQEGEKDK